MLSLLPFFIDPDVPSRQNPDEREWMHWIVANIPKTHISKGDCLASYIGPIPHQLGCKSCKVSKNLVTIRQTRIAPIMSGRKRKSDRPMQKKSALTFS